MPSRFFSKSSLFLFSLIAVRSSIFDGSLKWFGTDPTDAKFPEPIPIFKSTHSNVESLTSLEISLLLLLLFLVGAIIDYYCINTRLSPRCFHLWTIVSISGGFDISYLVILTAKLKYLRNATFCGQNSCDIS